MRIVIVGCSGFVGTRLKSFFEGLDNQVIALKVRDNTRQDMIRNTLEGTDVLINLAGLSIFGRWSKSYKEALYKSRIQTTTSLVEAMKSCENGPKRFISTSAVGIYPNDIDSDEYQSELSQSFLAQICKDWEKEALKAESIGVSTAILRSGVVLGKEGGMFKKLYYVFNFGLGGKVGSGRQPLSWIHIDDLCMIYKLIIEEKKLEGIYNLCAPVPTTNMELTQTLGRLMHRPTVFPVPAWVLRLIFSQGADFMLEGAKVYPKRLIEAGYEFNYKGIDEALKSFLKKKKSRR